MATVHKTVSIEIDAEIFFDEISDSHTSWSFDKFDLNEEDYPRTYEYLRKYESGSLEMLQKGEIDFLEVYRDTF